MDIQQSFLKKHLVNWPYDDFLSLYYITCIISLDKKYFQRRDNIIISNTKLLRECLQWGRKQRHPLPFSSRSSPQGCKAWDRKGNGILLLFADMMCCLYWKPQSSADKSLTLLGWMQWLLPVPRNHFLTLQVTSSQQVLPPQISQTLLLTSQLTAHLGLCKAQRQSH